MLEGEIDNRDSTGCHFPYVPSGVFVAPERDEHSVVIGGGRQSAKPVVDGQYPVVVFCEPRHAADLSSITSGCCFMSDTILSNSVI